MTSPFGKTNSGSDSGKGTIAFWNISTKELFQYIRSDENGLAESEASTRLKQNGVTLDTKQWILDLRLLLSQFKSPLVLILIGAVILAFFLGDYTNSAIVLVIIILSTLLGFWQERNAGRAVGKLRSMVQVTASVKRDGTLREIPIHLVVAGDIVFLNAGDIIPGDGRLITCNDLHVNEAALTGESFPSEKSLDNVSADAPLSERNNCVFKGTNVINGTGTALMIVTGKDTELEKIVSVLDTVESNTAFEKGTRHFGFLLLQVTLTFSVIILLLNMFLGKPLIDSALFALAVAIGITPELLPAIITIGMSAGAKRMAEKKVIVKKLSAIQNFGAIDVFCTDKTGTLTEGIVKVHSTVDASGNPNNKVLQYVYWNALFETGFSNPIDEAIRNTKLSDEGAVKVDEVPYDFTRKRLSVVVNIHDKHIMITKGAVKNILDVCGQVENKEGNTIPLAATRTSLESQYNDFGRKGLRTIAVAYKDVTASPVITKDDEKDLTFLGFVVFYDPPKSGITESLRKLNDAGITVKLITGDNAGVAAYLAAQIGIQSETLTGSEIRKLSDDALASRLQHVNVFAETEPDQKERIISVLQKSGHSVGFIGDGINDTAAMKIADVGISVDTAVDVAKETADIVLLEKNLDVLHDGVMEGRKTFVNTLKYVFITTSANFGNMFSVAGASLLLPFLPLLPKQILLINFLTDLPAMALASDTVDQESIQRPLHWNNKLIRNFMIVFGLQSTFFDFLTFFLLSFVLKVSTSAFRTGWFVECVITELFTLMVIRTRHSFYKSKPGNYLLYNTLAVAVLTFACIFPPAAGLLEFVSLPTDALIGIVIIVILYVVTAEITKKIFFKRQGY